MSDPSAIVSAAPFVADLKPYVDVLVPPIVTALIGLAAAKFSKWTGVQLQAGAVASLKSAAATQAGALVAQAEDNLAGRRFSTGSPEVAVIAARVAAALPATAALAGATPEALRAIALGEIGKLQAMQTPLQPRSASAATCSN
jgi:hypothetical protein